MFTALKRDLDNAEPRPAPPPATAIDFPCCEPLGEDPATREPHDLFRLFSEIHKGPKQAHLDALNVSLKNNVPIEELVPADYLPPKSWLQPPPTSTESSSPQKSYLIPGGSLPAHEAFHIRVKELLIDNKNGFRTINRLPPHDKNDNQPRLVFFRKFWEELDCLADYWDTSADRYTETATTPETSPATDAGKESSSPAPKLNDDTTTATSPLTNAEPIASTSAPPKSLYTGHRTSTGSLTPPHHLPSILSAYLTPLALPHRLRLQHPHSPPLLQLGPLLLPTPPFSSLLLVPSDQTLARQGVQEGPLLGAFAADFALWREEGEERGQGIRERMHLLRELGCVLVLAQRRAREGQVEKKRGEGQWWAERRRWGGGTGVAVFKKGCDGGGGSGGGDAKESQRGGRSVDAGDEPGAGAGSLIEAQKRRVKRLRRGQAPDPRRMSAAAVVPPRSLWERNVLYRHIGMEKGGEFDDIYLLSTTTHHLSILHARIPTQYLAYLSNIAEPTSQTPAQYLTQQHMQREAWFKIELRRSKWFNFFDPEERMEAMGAVWGVLGWGVRMEGGEGGEGK